MSDPSQSEAWFAPDIHMAWRDEDIVVLDLRSDTYGCLVGAGATIRPGHTPGSVMVKDPDVCADLMRAGLTTPSPSPRPLILEAASELTPASRTNPGLILAAGLNGLLATHRFRTSDLTAQVARVRLLNARSRSRPTMPVEDAASLFLAALPWLPFAGDCLQRAFMLHAHLAACGIASDWVFGVRTWPFVAHCWIQIGGQVVGDRLERVRRFTPILRVT
jgi:hypothetical protein